MKKDDIIQAIVIADNFTDEFIPITNDLPFSLFPIANKRLIDYTLEFLALGGVEETFLFCCTHVDDIKKHIKASLEQSVEWSSTMKLHIIVSESCQSFGDCLRDIDAKGLLRGSFVLIEPGTVSNIKLAPLIKKHNEIVKKDKGAAMTLIYQETGIGQMGRCPKDDLILAANSNNRVLFHKKTVNRERKIQFPLEIFLENSNVSIHHNLRDTHISICSPSVLPLFSDNFDFQTKDDFIKGLLINEEILDSRIYYEIIKGVNYGGCITSWRMYQAINYDLNNHWLYPLSVDNNRSLKNKLIIGEQTIITTNLDKLTNCLIGKDCKIGKNVEIDNCIIFPNCKIDDNVVINNSIIGPNCWIKSKCKITENCVFGKNVVIENGQIIKNSLIQSTPPEDSSDKLSKYAYRLHVDSDDDDGELKRFPLLYIGDFDDQEVDATFSDDSDDDDDDDGDGYGRGNSPIPDDTKLFFNEVIDSLTRGFEDELQCDNLILEINSSRYAYNVTVKEVNFNVIKAILIMSLRLPIGQQYFSQFHRLLSYFSPILKNYLRNESAMIDALQAVEDATINNETINEKWIMFALKWLYDKDYITEEAILNWANHLDKDTKFYKQVKPFVDWLEEAEEESDDD